MLLRSSNEIANKPSSWNGTWVEERNEKRLLLNLQFLQAARWSWKALVFPTVTTVSITKQLKEESTFDRSVVYLWCSHSTSPSRFRTRFSLYHISLWRSGWGKNAQLDTGGRTLRYSEFAFALPSNRVIRWSVKVWHFEEKWRGVREIATFSWPFARRKKSSWSNLWHSVWAKCGVSHKWKKKSEWVETSRQSTMQGFHPIHLNCEPPLF